MEPVHWARHFDIVTLRHHKNPMSYQPLFTDEEIGFKEIK
jgi:hypothetical protein